MNDEPIRLTFPPVGHVNGLANLKARIYAAQPRAMLAVNPELVLLYRHIGRDIFVRQPEAGWGSKVIERLAHDLHKRRLHNCLSDQP